MELSQLTTILSLLLLAACRVSIAKKTRCGPPNVTQLHPPGATQLQDNAVNPVEYDFFEGVFTALLQYAYIKLMLHDPVDDWLDWWTHQVDIFNHMERHPTFINSTGDRATIHCWKGTIYGYNSFNDTRQEASINCNKNGHWDKWPGKGTSKEWLAGCHFKDLTEIAAQSGNYKFKGGTGVGTKAEVAIGQGKGKDDWVWSVDKDGKPIVPQPVTSVTIKTHDPWWFCSLWTPDGTGGYDVLMLVIIFGYGKQWSKESSKFYGKRKPKNASNIENVVVLVSDHSDDVEKHCGDKIYKPPHVILKTCNCIGEGVKARFVTIKAQSVTHLTLDRVNVWGYECPAGFTGMHCETNIDDCETDPCKDEENKHCSDQINDYVCLRDFIAPPSNFNPVESDAGEVTLYWPPTNTDHGDYDRLEIIYCYAAYKGHCHNGERVPLPYGEDTVKLNQLENVRYNYTLVYYKGNKQVAESKVFHFHPRNVKTTNSDEDEDVDEYDENPANQTTIILVASFSLVVVIVVVAICIRRMILARSRVEHLLENESDNVEGVREAEQHSDQSKPENSDNSDGDEMKGPFPYQLDDVIRRFSLWESSFASRPISRATSISAVAMQEDVGHPHSIFPSPTPNPDGESAGPDDANEQRLSIPSEARRGSDLYLREVAKKLGRRNSSLRS